ncbi:hypothetical protein JCM5350_002286 [Sporobolomyces pararoseus]
MPSLKRRQPRITSSDAEEEQQDPRNVEEEESDSESQGRVNDSLLEKIDPQYLNQRLDIKQGDVKLKAPISQLNQMEKHLKETGDLLYNVATEFAESLREEVKDVEFEEDKYIKILLENQTMKLLDKEFRTVLEKTKEMNIRQKVLHTIRQKVIQAHPVTNVWETFQQKSDQELQEFKSLSTREKFQKDKEYVGFITLVWEEFSGGAPMPNIKKFLPREVDENGGENGQGAGGEGESSDEELEIGAQSTDFRCPLTASILEDPYTSTECPHSYSGEAIKEYITKTGRGSIACPVAGCSKVLTLAKVAKDDSLRKRVEKYLKRLQNNVSTQRGQDDGDGEGGASGTAGGATGGRTYVAIEDSDED